MRYLLNDKAYRLYNSLLLPDTPRTPFDHI